MVFLLFIWELLNDGLVFFWFLCCFFVFWFFWGCFGVCKGFCVCCWFVLKFVDGGVWGGVGEWFVGVVGGGLFGVDDVEFMFDVVVGVIGCCLLGGLVKVCFEVNWSLLGFGGEMLVVIVGRGEWYEGEWVLCIYEKVDGSS